MQLIQGNYNKTSMYLISFSYHRTANIFKINVFLILPTYDAYDEYWSKGQMFARKTWSLNIRGEFLKCITIIMKTESSHAPILTESVFEDIQTAYFYHILRQQITNLANAD